MLNSRMNSSLVVVSPQHTDTIGNASTCRRDLLLLGNPSSTRSLRCNSISMLNPKLIQRQRGIRDLSKLEGVIAMPHLANHDFYSMKNRRSASIRSLSSGLRTESEEGKENATITTVTEDETSYSSFQRYPITPACVGGSQKSQSLRSLLSPEGRHAFYSRNQRSQSQRSLISSLSSSHSSTADQLPTVPLGFHSTSQKNLFQSATSNTEGRRSASLSQSAGQHRGSSSLGNLTEDEPLYMPQKGICNATFDRNSLPKPRLSVMREILSSQCIHEKIESSPSLANSEPSIKIDLQLEVEESEIPTSTASCTMTPTRSKLVHRSKRDLFATSKSKSSSYLGCKQPRDSLTLSPTKTLTRPSLRSLPLASFGTFDSKNDEESLASPLNWEKESRDETTPYQQSQSKTILITPSKASKEEEEEGDSIPASTEDDSIPEIKPLSFQNLQDSFVRIKKKKKKTLSLKDLNRNLQSFPKLPIDDSTVDDEENYCEFFSSSETFSCPTIVSRSPSQQQEHAVLSQLEAELMQLEGKVLPTIVGRSSSSMKDEILSKIEFDLMQLEGMYEFGLNKIASIRRTLFESIGRDGLLESINLEGHDGEGGTCNRNDDRDNTSNKRGRDTTSPSSLPPLSIAESYCTYVSDDNDDKHQYKDALIGKFILTPTGCDMQYASDQILESSAVPTKRYKLN